MTEDEDPIVILARGAREAIERDRALAAMIGVLFGALREADIINSAAFDDAVLIADGLLPDAETLAGTELLTVIRLVADQIVVSRDNG